MIYPEGPRRICRRTLLATGLATIAGQAIAGSAARRAGRLGIADITVMRDLLRDYPGTLRRLAAMRYTTMGVRLVGYGGAPIRRTRPLEKARMVRDAGLDLESYGSASATQTMTGSFDQAAAMGAKVVVLTTAPPFISGKRLETTRAAFDAWLPHLVTLAEKARARRLRLAYHNHWYDHAPLDGESPFDIMARQVSPELLAFEIDLAWTWYAGIAPLDLLARLGPRVVSMHWKDIDRTRGRQVTEHAVAPGAGEMRYAALLPRIASLTRAVGYVEVDRPDDGLAAAAEAARFIRAAIG